MWTIFSKKEKFISWWQPKECKFYNNLTCQLVNNTEEIRIAAHVNVYMCWMFYFNFSVFHIILHYLRLQIFKRFVVVIIIDCPRNDWQNFTKKSCHLLMIDVNLVLNIVLLTRTSTNTLLKDKRVFLWVWHSKLYQKNKKCNIQHFIYKKRTEIVLKMILRFKNEKLLSYLIKTFLNALITKIEIFINIHHFRK